MAASGASPVSSPRLPSPPPIAEDQLGPKSPSPATEEQQKLFSLLDHGASRRIRPGTKAEDMAEGPPLVDLSEIDSAFQLTEHIKALHYSLTHPDGSDSTVAIDREMAMRLAHPPENVDRTLWLYELCRFLTQKANSIVIALFSDNPACSSITCPEMRASEWQYLCAVHDPPKSCCAIDYCCHTLDWAANTLTSPKNFPSRLAMGTDSTIAGQQVRALTNIFRRVYRIFAHAWFQHQDMFWKVETHTGLYILFKAVCDVYGLIQDDNYTIPPEAEGDEPHEESLMPTPLIMKREPSEPGPLDTNSILDLSTAGTTKRHRHSPSVSATSVSTVVEENEEEEEPLDTPSTVQNVVEEAAPEDAAPAELAKSLGDSSSDEDHDSRQGTVLIGAEDAQQNDEAEKQDPSTLEEERPPADSPEPEIPATATAEEESPGDATGDSAAVLPEEKSSEHDAGDENKPAASVEAEASNTEVQETETSTLSAAAEEPEEAEKANANADLDAGAPAVVVDADKDKAKEAVTASE